MINSRTCVSSLHLKVCIGYELTLDEVVMCANSKSCDPPVVTNSKQLTIKYSTGVEQVGIDIVPSAS